MPDYIKTLYINVDADRQEALVQSPANLSPVALDSIVLGDTVNYVIYPIHGDGDTATELLTSSINLEMSIGQYGDNIGVYQNTYTISGSCWLISLYTNTPTLNDDIGTDDYKVYVSEVKITDCTALTASRYTILQKEQLIYNKIIDLSYLIPVENPLYLNVSQSDARYLPIGANVVSCSYADRVHSADSADYADLANWADYADTASYAYRARYSDTASYCLNALTSSVYLTVLSLSSSFASASISCSYACTSSVSSLAGGDGFGLGGNDLYDVYNIKNLNGSTQLRLTDFDVDVLSDVNFTNNNIGINWGSWNSASIKPNEEWLEISHSKVISEDNFSGLHVFGDIWCDNFTASNFVAGHADDADTLDSYHASYFQPLLITGSTYPITSSWSNNAINSRNAISASFASSSISASYAPVEPSYSASVSTIKQNTLVTGGTYNITSSWSNNAISSSYIDAGNITTGTLNNSRLPLQINITGISASHLGNTIGTSSWSNNSIVSNTSLYASQSQWSVSSSYASSSISSSFATTASYFNQKWLVTGSTYPITSSWTLNALTSSYIGSGTTGYYPTWYNNTLTNTSSIFNLGNNVGIGTTAPTSRLVISGIGQGLSSGNYDDTGSVGATLHINDTQNAGYQGGAIVFGTNNKKYAAIKSDFRDGTSNGIGYLHFLTRTLVSDATMTPKMTINQIGQIGIGTITPGAKIEVHGGLITNNLNDIIELSRYSYYDTNAAYLRTYARKTISGSSGWPYSSFRIQHRIDSTDMGYIEFNPSGSQQGLALGSANAEVIRLHGTNVGIGTTTPTSPLAVYGISAAQTSSGTANEHIMRVWGSSTNVIDFGTSNISPYPGWIQVRDYSNKAVSYPLTLNANGGNVGIGTTAPLTVCDIKKATTSAYNNDLTYAARIGTGQNTVNIGFDTTINAGIIAAYSQSYDVRNLILNGNGGNVGIGNTSPIASLHVGNKTGSKAIIISGGGSAVSDGGILYINTGTGVANGYFGSPSAVLGGAFDATMAVGGYSGLKFYTVHTQRMIIDTNGKIGIGNTAPRAWLDVLTGSANTSGDAPGQLLITGPTAGTYGGQANVFIQSNDNQAADKGGTLAFGGRYVDANTAGAFFASIKGAKENSTSANLAGYLKVNVRTAANTDIEAVRVTSTGNVGIGNTTPISKLHVDSFGSSNPTPNVAPYLATYNGGANAANCGYEMFLSSSSGNKQAYISVRRTAGDTYNGLEIATTTVHPMRFLVGGTADANEKIRIDTSGNVGVGTTTPGALLHVQGNISSSNVYSNNVGNYIFTILGDSISEPVPPSPRDTWPMHVDFNSEIWGKANRFNYAVSGWTSEQVSSSYMSGAHLVRPITNNQVGVLTIWCGCNDIYGNTGSAQIYTQLKAVWAKAKSDNYKVYAVVPTSFADFSAPQWAEYYALTASILSNQTLYDLPIRADLFIPNMAAGPYGGLDGKHPSATGAIELGKIIGYSIDGYKPYKLKLSLGYTGSKGLDLVLNEEGNNTYVKNELINPSELAGGSTLVRRTSTGVVVANTYVQDGDFHFSNPGYYVTSMICKAGNPTTDNNYYEASTAQVRDYISASVVTSANSIPIRTAGGVISVNGIQLTSNGGLSGFLIKSLAVKATSNDDNIYDATADELKTFVGNWPTSSWALNAITSAYADNSYKLNTRTAESGAFAYSIVQRDSSGNITTPLFIGTASLATNADTLDSYHANVTTGANTIPVRTAGGVISTNGIQLLSNGGLSGFLVKSVAVKATSNDDNIYDATAAEMRTFLNTIGGSGTTGYVPMFDTANTITNSTIYQSSGKVGIDNTSPMSPLSLNPARSWNKISLQGTDANTIVGFGSGWHNTSTLDYQVPSTGQHVFWVGEAVGCQIDTGITVTGSIQAGGYIHSDTGYKSADTTVGATATFVISGSTFNFKNGLFVGLT